MKDCRECFEEYEPSSSGDDGFCSDFCAEQYDREMYGEDEDE